MNSSSADKPTGQAALAPRDEAAQSRHRYAPSESQDQTHLAAVEVAWDEEAERRLGAYDRGEVRAIDGELVLARAHVHATLKSTRSNRLANGLVTL